MINVGGNRMNPKNNGLLGWRMSEWRSGQMLSYGWETIIEGG
jgi:hypothetical protein